MSQYCDDHEVWDECADERWTQRQRDVAVGDPATMCYPDDRYPYVVTGVTPTTITLEEVDKNELEDKRDSMAGDWPVVDRSSHRTGLPGTGVVVKARRSEKRKMWYAHSTTPIAIGYARYLRDWSL